MPADLVTSMTLAEMAKLVARRANLAEYINAADAASNVAQVPTDAHDLDYVIELVNRGYDRFLRADTEWTFLKLPVRLVIGPSTTAANVIDGDASRYRLPPAVRSLPLGDFKFIDADRAPARVLCVDYPIFNDLREECPDATGTPSHATTRLTKSGDANHRLWEADFFPAPDAAFTVEADFRVRPYLLVDLGERHVAGADHDAAIVAAALYEHALSDGLAVAERRSDWETELARSIAIDGKGRGRIVAERQPTHHFAQGEHSRHGNGNATFQVNGAGI